MPGCWSAIDWCGILAWYVHSSQLFPSISKRTHRTYVRVQPFRFTFSLLPWRVLDRSGGCNLPGCLLLSIVDKWKWSTTACWNVLECSTHAWCMWDFILIFHALLTCLITLQLCQMCSIQVSIRAIIGPLFFLQHYWASFDSSSLGIYSCCCCTQARLRTQHGKMVLVCLYIENSEPNLCWKTSVSVCSFTSVVLSVWFSRKLK